MSRKTALALLSAGLLGAGLLAALAQDAPRFGTWGVDLAAMDKSVRPGDNFSDYVSGTWQRNAVLPPDRSRIGGFTDLQILSEQRLRAIIDELRARPVSQLNADERKLRDFMMPGGHGGDRGQWPEADAEGSGPDRRYQDPGTSGALMASPAHFCRPIYGVGIGVDDKNPDNYSLNLSQAGLGLPDRDYYLSDDEALVETRDAYRKYLADMMTPGGHGRCRMPAPTASWRWKPRSPRCSGPAPTAATTTRSTIPCRSPR